MSNINIIAFIIFILTLYSCKSLAQTSEPYYHFDSKESGIFDASLHIEKDSTIALLGGTGGYAYTMHGTLKKITPAKFIIVQDNPGAGVKIKTTDEFKRKVKMMDSSNDTLYFYGDDRSFVYKNRIFNLVEDVPVEDWDEK